MELAESLQPGETPLPKKGAAPEGPARVELTMEYLRQAELAFQHQKNQATLWFRLRLIVGYSSIILLSLTLMICTVILFGHQDYPEFVVNGATAALFLDILGVFLTIWKILLPPESGSARLEPVISIPDFEEQNAIRVSSEYKKALEESTLNPVESL